MELETIITIKDVIILNYPHPAHEALLAISI